VGDEVHLHLTLDREYEASFYKLEVVVIEVRLRVQPTRGGQTGLLQAASQPHRSLYSLDLIISMCGGLSTSRLGSARLPRFSPHTSSNALALLSPMTIFLAYLMLDRGGQRRGLF
jgi:hypothetical protein